MSRSPESRRRADRSGRWTVDLDWLWGVGRGDPTSPATLRMDVSGLGAEHAVAAWLATLPTDAAGVRGRGGWRADRTAPDAGGPEAGASAAAVGAGPAPGRVYLTSAGEDVADGLEAAAEAAHAGVLAAAREAEQRHGGGAGLVFAWTPLR